MESMDITLSALIPGVVVSVRAEEGQRVESGDTLILLDETDYALQLDQAEAMLAGAEAQLALVMKGARSEDVRQAEASFESALKDVERMRTLRESGSITQKQLDDMELRYTMATQTYDKIRRGARTEERAAVRANRDQAAAQVALFRKKMEDCRIVAPMNGTILNRYLEEGEFATPGGALFRLADLSVMEVMIYVPETELPRIVLGQSASVTVDAYPDRSFDGKVVYLSQTAEFTPKNIQTKDERTKLVFGVKIRVPNPDGSLKAGIPADVIL
jgi:HlyD family secretion protein